MSQSSDESSSHDIAIVGRACRLPGANSIEAFWALLSEGGCAVTSIPATRWMLARHFHPKQAERGKTYTWAAGILDDIWSFDPAVFGISPREAEQMDPQQRLLLELTWEALEDAGLRPSKLAGSDTGVFIGASAVDHANLRMLDMSAADAYMMTGNTLSILANRVSYIFDLHGPSFTIDTACSSSLVAMNEAVANLRSGRIDTAIVGGVSLLASPQSFVGFSQAAMLSRRGLCQAFSAGADGYVRAEGGVVLVLKTRAAAERDGDPIHALITASDINSDGRTNGISLPSQTFQTKLLKSLYADRGVDLNALAFIEAHGTGTPVGDPIEAAAIGEALGKGRGAPLPIGSVKTNIGHLEAASGLAGVLKAMLSLEHDQFPRSLHSETLNPAIEFDRFNLTVAQELVPLARSNTRRLAGVNSFGFGGTNAHVILADAPRPQPVSVAVPPSFLVLSAHSRAALATLAADTAARLAASDEQGALAIVSATALRRDHLAHRIVLPAAPRDAICATLDAFGNEASETIGIVRGTAVARAAPIAFVFSGNGSQYVGMGLVGYVRNPVFRARLDKISRAFEAMAGWSIVDALQSDDLATRLARTEVAQPLLFAIQSAACHTLCRSGLAPDVVIGHSVGEVAAAEAAGILDRASALKVIFARSLHQERAHDHGGMAVAIGSRQAIDGILADLPGLEIAAFNSPRAYTLSGRKADIASLSGVARRNEAHVRLLDLDYPFHSAGMAPVRHPLLHDLADLSPRPSRIPFMSTVTGGAISGEEADGVYWWRNVREPVRFADAAVAAMKSGVRVFVEIGPRASLLSHITDTIDERTASIATIAALEKADRGDDPFARTVCTAIARGAKVDEAKAYGSGPSAGAHVSLPHYPWQRQIFRLPESSESLGGIRPTCWHPLIGARINPDQLEWRANLDTTLHPWLADHVVDGQVILPGAAFAEMALAVARDWLGVDRVTVCELEILSPMQLSADSAREVACRVSPVANRLEIVSRPRLSQMPWHLHATAKVVRQQPAPAGVCRPSILVDPLRPREAPDRASALASTIYAMAAKAGLQFGPEFRQLKTAIARRSDRIVVDLIDAANDADFGLHPARLDSCFHGLIVTFAEARPAAYVPVRFGEIKLLKPGVAIVRSVIDILRHDARFLIVDVQMVDATGECVASIHEARFQAIRTARAVDLEGRIYAAHILASEPTAARHECALPLAALRRHIVEADPNLQMAEDYVLLEGWATALALQLARDLASNHIVDIDNLMENDRMPKRLRPWLIVTFDALERSGLCDRNGASILVDAGVALPDTNVILQTIAREHPALSIELLVAASLSIAVRAIAAGTQVPSMSRAIVDTFETGSSHVQAYAKYLDEVVRASLGLWPKDRALRILQIGFGPLTARALALAEETQARLTILEPDPRRLERARAILIERGDLEFVRDIDALATSGFDMVIAASALQGRTPIPRLWTELSRVMAQDAIVAAIEPPQSFFRDLVFGLEACLDESDARASLHAVDWRAMMQTADLVDAQVAHVLTDAGPALLLTARVENERRHRSATGTALIVGDETNGTQAAFATLLATAGLHVSVVPDSETAAMQSIEAPSTIVFFLRGPDRATEPLQTLRDQCMRLKRLVDDIGMRTTQLWLVASGPDGPDADMVAAFWAFSRTVANEVGSLDIRRVEAGADLCPEPLADRLRDLVLSGTDETDIVIEQAATRVLRFDSRPPRQTNGGAPAARLTRDEGAGLDRMTWTGIQRQAPALGEVEIIVEAAGLNFRDVMLGLGLLPEDSLENGFAGPNLGLECAGRIVRVGARVSGFRPGDRVMAFAKTAFSTHVTTPAALVAPMAEGVSMEAAATIPVAFLTAYYALMICARLKAREWVLIHGAAGGVGLAAIQVAQWRGARVIATAGSPEKRALLLSLGVDHVFDSRSDAFVDEVRRVTGEGVSIVLNSLSGEAMERSISVLKSFGRFVELGKRDYVANMHIGLRPFRRNLSYFGVDLDQLIVDDAQSAKRLMRSVLRRLAAGDFVPLPYRAFDAHETADAFRLMQQAGHIGKLVVRPPNASLTRIAHRRVFPIASDKLHLVTGGLGGFGLATAQWLADQGARDIMLVGRRGVATDAARDAVAALVGQGVRVRVEAIDVSNRRALQKLFERFGRDLPPLAGVVHSAMVLEDALLTNLSAEAMDRVLRPKVAGADHLDHFTRPIPLDYFILYSSATTLIGNPGQAAYVAANGFLEGLARQRRKAGLPGLAVAWGAISDVGILAQSDLTRERLADHAGIKGMKARAALQALGEILQAPHEAVVAIAPMDWSIARQHLAILQTPAYRRLTSRDATVAGTTRQIDIAALIAKMPPDMARSLVGDQIVDEIARVLRLPREDVSRLKPLSEIGLDSLMAVEFALGLGDRFTLHSPLSATASGFTVNELADHMIGLAGGHAKDDEAAQRAVVERHLNAETQDSALEDRLVAAHNADRRPEPSKAPPPFKEVAA